MPVPRQKEEYRCPFLTDPEDLLHNEESPPVEYNPVIWSFQSGKAYSSWETCSSGCSKDRMSVSNSGSIASFLNGCGDVTMPSSRTPGNCSTATTPTARRSSIVSSSARSPSLFHS